MAKFTGFYKVVDKKNITATMADSQDLSNQGAFNNYSWYARLISGSSSRMARYREYDLMDNDVDIARALDMIAEEMTGNNAKTDKPLELDLEDNSKEITGTVVQTLNAALSYWNNIHNWDNRLFSIARLMIKYGDIFFKQTSYSSRWEMVHPKTVLAAVVSEDDVTDVVSWQIKDDVKKFQASSSTSSYVTGLSGNGTQYENSKLYSSSEIIRFTLNDDMADSAPFGESILRSVYRSYKQKELLEDALLIYRIQRAPERRVFYIEVGKWPPHKVRTYIETVKNEIRQKRVPSFQGGQSEIDTVYNPHCLALDTRIALLDGRDLTLSEIIQEYEDGKELWTYSVNPKTGETVPGPITWAGITRRDAETVKITFDNGSTLIVTPDHKFPTQNRGEVRADELTPDDSLFPFSRKYEKLGPKRNEYEKIWDTSRQEWIWTHKMVSNKMVEFGKSHEFTFLEEFSNKKKTTIHHVDFNRFNNNPSNLVLMDNKDHFLLHSKTQKQRMADQKLALQNHKIVKIEKWHKIDTGCVTVDGKELNHNYHNFALTDCNIYIKNSMVEDFFLPQKADGRGSKIEVLPGGQQGLGNLEDLDYFMRKVFRGLRIPESYMQQGGEQGQGAIFNDGKPGIAYFQELKFAMYVARLQSSLERVLDEKFKEFLSHCKINVDSTLFRIKLPAPSNFGVLRQQEIDTNLLNTYLSADGIKTISKRFAQKRFLQFSESDMQENYLLLCEERGLDPRDVKNNLPLVYGDPEAMAGGGGFGGGGGGGGFGGLGGGFGGGGMGMDSGMPLDSGEGGADMSGGAVSPSGPAGLGGEGGGAGESSPPPAPAAPPAA